MRSFIVVHIERDGHIERTTIHAKTRRLALREAKRRFDDVIKVKRADTSVSGTLVALIVILILGAVVYFLAGN